MEARSGGEMPSPEEAKGHFADISVYFKLPYETDTRPVR